MAYFAEVSSGTVLRVIVADSAQWCVDHLGGTWLETANPYSAQAQTVKYCGPGYGVDPSFPERFAPQWVPPVPDPTTGAWSSYPKGAIVARNGSLWKSTMDGNLWEPGVSAWHPQPDITGVLPNWVQPTGAHDVWLLNAEVTHNGKRWRSQHAANVWEPGVSQWLDIDAVVVVGKWTQPTGAHDDYDIGARVTYKGKTWRSTVNANVWAPDVFGWVVV